MAELCLLHANCQGEMLQILLNTHADFSKHFTIKHVLNYTGADISLAIQNCKLYLYQHLTMKWGDLSSDKVLSQLPANASSLCIPNMFFMGPWPHWTNKAPISFANSVIEMLLAKRLKVQDVALIYLHGSDAILGDLEKIAEESLQKEEAREKFSFFKYTPLIRECWREEQLFITINHPSRRLLILTANAILKELGFSPLDAEIAKNDALFAKYEEFWLPIHPKVGKKLKLKYVDEKRLYPACGSMISHTEYVQNYLACRKAYVGDLLDFLRQKHEAKNAESNPEKEAE